MVCCAMSEFGLFQQDAVLSAGLSGWAGRRRGIIAAHWKAATRVSRPAQSSAQPEAQHWHAGLSGVIGDSSIEQMSEETSLQDKLKQHKCQLIFKGEMFSVRLSWKRSSHKLQRETDESLVFLFFFVDVLKVRLHTIQWRKSIIHHLQMLENNYLVSPTCSVGL